MKKVLIIHLVTFIFIGKTLSQDVQDGPIVNDNCFIAMKVASKANTAPISRTFCVDDKITVKLRDNKIIRSKINRLSQNLIITADDFEIDVSKIKWIKKSKLGTGQAIVSGLVTAGGLAVLIHVSQGNVEFDEIPIQGGLGIMLVAAGIGLSTSRTKFQMERGDKLIFKD